MSGEHLGGFVFPTKLPELIERVNEHSAIWRVKATDYLRFENETLLYLEATDNARTYLNIENKVVTERMIAQVYVSDQLLADPKTAAVKVCECAGEIMRQGMARARG